MWKSACWWHASRLAVGWAPPCLGPAPALRRVGHVRQGGLPGPPSLRSFSKCKGKHFQQIKQAYAAFSAKIFAGFSGRQKDRTSGCFTNGCTTQKGLKMEGMGRAKKGRRMGGAKRAERAPAGNKANKANKANNGQQGQLLAATSSHKQAQAATRRQSADIGRLKGPIDGAD